MQLVQILDFIWTWARDIHRPSIRKCLRGIGNDIREFSPTSSDAFTRSESFFSDRSLPFVGTPSSTHQPGFSATNVDYVPNQENSTTRNEFSQTPFKWVGSRDISAMWSPETSVRHSDLVLCSFRALQLPDKHESFESLAQSLENNSRWNTTLSYLLALVQQSQCTIPLRRRFITAIACEWVGAEVTTGSNVETNPNEIVMASFFFRTLFQREN